MLVPLNNLKMSRLLKTSMAAPSQYAPDIVKLNHSAGFFSCSTVRLAHIIKYFNENKSLPLFVDSLNQYMLYKRYNTDVTFHYYEHYNSVIEPIDYTHDIDFFEDKQFTFYKDLSFDDLNPFVRKYFSPSVFVRDKIDLITNKYNIDFGSTCALFHRGNDKVTETKICTHEEKIEKAKELMDKYSNIRFMIQSDETDFIEKVKEAFPENSFCCEDEIVHVKSDPKIHVHMTNRNNIEDSAQNFLAIMIIMSRCKHLITSAGNCDLWISLYRGHTDNLIQYNDGVWN